MRSLRNMLMTCGTLGLIGISLLPDFAYAKGNFQNNKPKQKTEIGFTKSGTEIFSPDRIAKQSNLEIELTGQLKNAITGEPVPAGVEIEFLEYLGEGKVGESLGILKTGPDGSYGKQSCIDPSDNPGVKSGSWGGVKRGFKDVEVRSKTSTAYEGVVEMRITDENHYTAVRYVNLAEVEEFDTSIIHVHDVEVYDKDWNLVKRDFMDFFDEWCRSANGCTQRWGTPDEGYEQPKFFIKTALATPDKINLAKEIIQNDLVRFTKGFISNPYIEEGEEIPEYAKYGTDGWVVVKWKDEGGAGYNTAKLDGNRIYSAGIIFNLTGPDRETYLQELTQILGLRTETETCYPWDKFGNYIAVVDEMGKILYLIPAGSKSQDRYPAPS